MSDKKKLRNRLKLGLKDLSKEVLINYLANLAGIIIQWFINNWKTILFPMVLFLWGIIIEFSRKTYSFTGTQIIISFIFFIIFIIVVFNASKIRKWFLRHREEFFDYKEFYWKYQAGDSPHVIGPFCKNCAKQMLFIDEDANGEMGKTIDEMFGDDRIDVYTCGSCGDETEQEIPLDKLKKAALKHYTLHILKQ